MSRGDPALVPIEERPFNAEAPMGALVESLTPSNLFYVRNHFDVPSINAESWRLTVDGVVGRPLELSLKELQTFFHHTLSVTLECAGNGRRGMTPLPPGTPWAYGAVSTARFTGTPLHLVLERAGLRPEAVELLFLGVDKGEVERGRVETFARSLSVENARHPDVLLAWAMNGEALAPEHGFPLRLVVPRWYGMASIKWLVRISALSRGFDGYFQKERYVYLNERGAPDGTPVTFTRVRAVIGQPGDGTILPSGSVEVAGTAWSGAAPISRVMISTDGGHSWADARLNVPLSPYAATPWRFTWVPPRTGGYTLVARATDVAGNTQPLEPLWNVYGYGNNAAHRIQVTIL